jgi:hypothetical protein
MLNKNAVFPYPLLRPEPRDFDQSRFVDNITLNETDSGFELITDFQVTSPYIQSLLKQGKVKFSVYIECKSTFFREWIDVDPNHTTIFIPAGDVHSSVSITPCIKATGSINSYNPPDMAPAFQGIAFSMDEDQLLGIGTTRSFQAIYEDDVLPETEPMFVYEINSDSENTLISKRFDSAQITILLPPSSYDAYSRCKDSPEEQSSLLALMVLPVLMEAIAEADPERESDYDQQPWCLTLRQKIHEIAIARGQTEADLYENSFQTAQLLLDGCSATALLQIAER